jgi:hypothetical protein
MALQPSGSAIDQDLRGGPAPSIAAAWSSSCGMPDMKAVNTRTPNGTAMVESATIRPGTGWTTPTAR